MGQASVVTRMRTGDIRSVPLAAWFFGLLVIAYAYLLISGNAFRVDPFNLPSFFALLAPLVFATAMSYAAPVDRRFFWGAALIGASQLPHLVELALTRFAGFRPDWGAGLSPQSFSWVLELAGVVLLAVAIGRIRSGRNWLWLAIGLAIFVIGDIQNAAFWASNPFPPDEVGFVYPLESIAVTFVGGLTIVAWAYLLGAAIEHRHRAFAIASGIFVALSAFGLVNEFLYDALVPAGNNEMAQLVLPAVRSCENHRLGRSHRRGAD